MANSTDTISPLPGRTQTSRAPSLLRMFPAPATTRSKYRRPSHGKRVHTRYAHLHSRKIYTDGSLIPRLRRRSPLRIRYTSPPAHHGPCLPTGTTPTTRSKSLVVVVVGREVMGPPKALVVVLAAAI